MTLQIALILIGLVIIAGAILSAYDRSKIRRRHYQIGQRDDEAGIEDSHEQVPIPTLQPSSRLDINPASPTDMQKRHIRSDVEINLSQIKTADHTLMDEIEALEQAAGMPISYGVDELGSAGNISTDEEIYLAGQSMPIGSIDFIVNLPGQSPVPRDRALGVYRQNEYMLEKPRHIYGLRKITGLWSDLEQDPKTSEYNAISMAIQIVDARGPIDESELNTFVQMALKMADRLKRPTKFAISFEEGLERAQELDAFCKKFDVIASINIISNSTQGFSGRAINTAASQYGMEFGPMEIFHMKNDDAKGCRHQFSLASMYNPGTFNADDWDNFHTQGLTIFMNVPVAHEPTRVYDRMIETASGIAGMLGGKLLDQEQKPISNQGIAIVRNQIEHIDQEMVEFGIHPGSEAALRVF